MSSAIYYPTVPSFEETLISKLEAKVHSLKNAYMAKHDPTRVSRVDKIMDELDDLLVDMEESL